MLANGNAFDAKAENATTFTYSAQIRTARLPKIANFAKAKDAKPWVYSAN